MDMQCRQLSSTEKAIEQQTMIQYYHFNTHDYATILIKTSTFCTNEWMQIVLAKNGFGSQHDENVLIEIIVEYVQ